MSCGNGLQVGICPNSVLNSTKTASTSAGDHLRRRPLSSGIRIDGARLLKDWFLSSAGIHVRSDLVSLPSIYSSRSLSLAHPMPLCPHLPSRSAVALQRRQRHLALSLLHTPLSSSSFCSPFSCCVKRSFCHLAPPTPSVPALFSSRPPVPTPGPAYLIASAAIHLARLAFPPIRGSRIFAILVNLFAPFLFVATSLAVSPSYSLSLLSSPRRCCPRDNFRSPLPPSVDRLLSILLPPL